MQPYADQQRRTLIISIALFLLLAATIVFVGYRSYRNFEANARAETKALLSTIATAKLQGLSDWRANLLDNANLIYQNEAFSDAAAQYIQDQQNAALHEHIRDWLDAYKKNNEFTAVSLLDRRGKIILSSPAAITLDMVVTQKIPQASQSGKVTFVDFYRDKSDGQVYLAVLIPVSERQQAIGFILLQVDPKVHLYPLLTQQATQNAQTQSFLVRRSESAAVFLSPFRFRPDAPLNLTAAANQEESLAVKAISGQTGIVEGVDYRGVAMFADIQPVPNSPWWLVTSITTTDMYAPVNENFGRTVIVTGTVIFYLGLGAVLVWRQRQLRYYQSEAEAADVLRKTQEELLRLTGQLDHKVRERTAELQDVNQQLRALSQQMVEMQERQIKDLARELHDRIGQNLTAININLSLINQLLPKNASDKIRARLADTTHLVEETVARMRNVIAEFLPPMLESYGLAPALVWYGEQFSARTNIRVQVINRRGEAARLAPEVEIGLFRIVQEALTNVAKHARATQVEIELEDIGGEMWLVISDDGIGFDPQVSAQPGHWGFAMMRERARTLGAGLEIQAAAGAGTKISLRVPL